MISNATSFQIPFGGGLNTLSGPLSIANNESPNCKNVHGTLASTLQRRNGNTLIDTALSGTSSNGLFDYWQDSATHFLMDYVDDNLYKMDSVSGSFDGTLDSLTFGTAMSNNVMEFDQFNESGVNYLIMSTHSRDTIQKWTGSGDTTDLSSDADLPAGKYIKSWRGYLFIANVSSYESRAYYNNVSGSVVGATAWDPLDYQDIRTNDGDFITGLAVLKGRLYTFKRYSIHRWTYFGGTPLFGLKTSVTGIGTQSSKTIVNITHPKYGEVLVFLGTDGRFYIFDGSQAVPISTKIEINNGVTEFYLNSLNHDHTDRAVATNYEANHWYMCWVPTGSATTPNWCIVWDYYTDAWWPFNGMNASACTTALSGGTKKLYWAGADDGKLYQGNSGDSDNGTAITANYESKKFDTGDYPMLKAQEYVDLQFKNTPAETIHIYNRSDWVNSWGDAESRSLAGAGFILGSSSALLGTSVLGGSEGVGITIDLPVINHTEQLRFYTSSSNQAWHLYHAAIVAKGIGYGGSGINEN